MARAIPVGTRARPPAAAMVTSALARRSAPASPGRAYAGRSRSGSSRNTSTLTTSSPDIPHTLASRDDPAPGRVRTMLVWLDLEMTGLDPARDRIVEIASLVTDDELEV